MASIALVIALITSGIALRANNEANIAKQEVKILRHELELKELERLNKNKKEK